MYLFETICLYIGMTVLEELQTLNGPCIFLDSIEKDTVGEVREGGGRRVASGGRERKPVGEATGGGNGMEYQSFKLVLIP